MLLDIALGLVAASAYAFLSGLGLTPQLLMLGVAFALLPDADFLISAARKRSFLKVDHTHRDLLHYPLPYLLVGGLITQALAPALVPLFLILSIAHFVHDSVGIGWGIPWLFPLVQGHLKLFSDREGGFSWTDAVFWKPEERARLVARHHDPDWIAHHHRGFSRTVAVELALLLVALAVLIIWLR